MLNESFTVDENTSQTVNAPAEWPHFTEISLKADSRSTFVVMLFAGLILCIISSKVDIYVIHKSTGNTSG